MNRRRRALDQLDDDIRDHIERETRENIDRGMPPEQARSAAFRKFGNPTRVKENTLEVWSHVWIEQLLQDVRYGSRILLRQPRFTVAVVLTLALGIGMNTAIFSVVNSVLLRPLDYPNSERLVWIADYDPNIQRDWVALPDFYDWRERARSYTGMAAYGFQQAALAIPSDAIQVTGVAIAGDFWKITGARPAMGRLFGPEELDAVVITWEFFERQFGGDASAIGRPVSLDGRPVIITGVLPKDFRFQFPMWWISTQPQPIEAYMPLPRSDRNAQAFAALKPGVQTGEALAELDALEKHILEEHRGSRRPLTTKLRVEPLQEKLVGSARRALWLLLAAGGFVLLIACANIANLVLVRSTARRREMAVRAAVGAGRMRLIRQLLVESLVLALLGGAAGLVVARWAIAVLVRISSHAVPRLGETAIDGWVLAFALAVSIGTGAVFGAGPAFALWRTNLHDALKDGARTPGTFSGLRVRRLLVAAELAFAIVLLTGAGLMVKSFWRMNAHAPGFAPERVLVMRVKLTGPRYRAKPAQEAYMREVQRRIESAPGVQAGGLSIWALFLPTDQARAIRLNAATTGYLQALGVRLLKGRWLSDGDSNVALLNESMARQTFGHENPLGREIPNLASTTVVGVVSDLKYSKLDAEPPPEAYLPYQQFQFRMIRDASIAVRTAGNTFVIAPVIRKLISDIDPGQPVYDMKTLEQELADSIAPRRFNLFVLGTFAAAALLLAMVGIYGVMAYSVAERTREIGVRMALGAQRNQVVRMVVLEGVTVAGAGITAGLAAALGLTRLMTSLLYEVKANDPWTFAVVAIALAATALLASCGPALKAAWIDPVIALRHE